MASLVGAIFDEYSTLNAAEKAKAVAGVGANVSFLNAFGPGSALTGTADNDLFLVNDSGTKITESKTGGIDIVVSSASYSLDFNVEHLILTGNANISGTGNSLDNVIAGNDGNNTLDGGIGDDLLLGGAGNDYLTTSTGEDTLCGGAGDDTLQGSAGGDVMDGGEGNDSINSSAGDDTIDGGAGNDTILSGGGNDLVSGGEGNDIIDTGAGDDTITGGAGDDTITSGAGRDVFYFGAGSGTTRITDFHDHVDIIEIQAHVNGSAIETVADVLATLSHDAANNATITLGDKIVTLVGIADDDVNAGFFKIV